MNAGSYPPPPPPPGWSGTPPRRRGHPLALGLVVGLLIGGAVGFYASSVLLNPICPGCPADLVLELEFTSTGAFHEGTAMSLYNFSVLNTGNESVPYSDAAFGFTNGSGVGVSPASEGNWTFTVSGAGGQVTARLDPTTGAWEGFGSMQILAGQRWTISAPGPWLDGGAFTVYGSAHYVGSVSVGIQ